MISGRVSGWRSYLVVDGDLRVGVPYVQGLDLQQVALLRKFHHLELHGGHCCQGPVLQLAAHTGTDRPIETR